MRPTVVRVVAGIALAVALFAAVATPANAVVTGGCTATGVSSSGDEIDLTTATVWHVRTGDSIRLAGSAPTPQTDVTVAATAFGFEIPLGSGSVDGVTFATSDAFEVRTLAVLGRSFLITGHSRGPEGACDGHVLVVIDDANPITTVLGGGGAVAAVIGLVLLGWAVRNPITLVRRGTGLIGLVLIGAGGSLVMQQALPAGQAPLGPGPIAGEPGRSPFTEGVAPFVESVLSPAQLSLDPVFAAQSAILTVLILVLLPFPSQLFNSTLSANWDEIRGWFRRLPFARRSARLMSEPQPPLVPRAWWRQPAILAFVLGAGLLYGLLDPTFGLDARSAVTYVGLVAGLLLVTWLADLPRRSLHGRLTGDRGHLWVIPATLIVAGVCVLISRLVGYLPGYLYGLIIGYAFLAKIEPPHEGRAGTLGAWWMLALAAAAWLTLGAVRVPGVQDTLPGAIAEAVLAAIVVAGIEGVVFALMPLRFLPGELAFRWQRITWAMLYAIGLFGFVFIFLNPANGYVPAPDAAPLGIALGLFIAFGLASILFWGYFRYRPKPNAA